nr:20S proteasome subunit alpha A-2 [Paratrimastix eleionoma]
MASRAGYDRYISIFSPEGKLFQIEYACKAIRTENLTAVAVRGSDCVVVVTEKKVPDKLIDPDTVQHVFKITSRIGAMFIGIQADSRALLGRIRNIAHNFKFENGIDIPCDFLAKRVADFFQYYTQHAYARPFAVAVILFTVDDERGPQLFKCEPSGFYAGYKATATGIKEAEAINTLEKKLRPPRDTQQMGYNDALKLALSTLQSVVAREFQSTELEVAVVRRDQGPDHLEIQKVTPTEIDAALTSIVEGGALEEYLAQRREIEEGSDDK